MSPASPRRSFALAACILAAGAGAAGVVVAVVSAQDESPRSEGTSAVVDPPRADSEPEEHGQRRPLPPPKVLRDLPPDGGPEFNRLVFELSPYLLQHARNPVDWYPWGDAAFEKARKEDKPVFLSVGYSTCHWCHVMERESFEDDEVARVMNEHFVSIKVDREERPDVDAVYMAAVQAMTGRGGWPMSVWLAPDGRPLLGGTYFPPEDRFGRPGFKSILLKVADLWKTRRDDLLNNAAKLTEHVRSQVPGGGAAELGEATLAKAQTQYANSFDPDHGGFGGAPKFPRSHSLSFLLRHHARTGDEETLRMVETTLDRMDRGGMHDHLGGGFHRYSTDGVWLVPHFEKMLYDQALLARTYLEAYQVTGKERYAEVARDVFRYVLRDLTDPQGGFQSAEDADSEGEEGKFYAWRRVEVERVLGREDAEVFARVYGVTEDGNFREEATGEVSGANILHLPRPIEEVARLLETDAGDLETRLAAMRRKLFEARERRVRPHKDDKVLADWNGLMIGTLAYGGRVLREPAYREAAERAAGFVLETMRKDGRLLHRWRAGDAAIPAFLDDYAFLSLGLLDLYEATFNPRWLRESIRLAEEMDRLFWDPEEGGFRLAARDGEALIATTKELYDGAIPSGNSAAMLALLKLGKVTMREDFRKRAEENLEYFSSAIDGFPMAYPFALQALGFLVGPTKEVVLAGPLEVPAMEEMRRALDRRFLPEAVTIHRPAGAAAGEIVALVPFVEGQTPLDGKPTAYVCENYACKLPTTDPVTMASLLGNGP